MKPLIKTLAAIATALCAGTAQADAVTDWNVKTGELIIDAKIGTPPAVRLMALVQTAANDAVQAAARRGASPEAALAAAHRVVLGRMLPALQPQIDAAYQAALSAAGERGSASSGPSAAVADGLAAGEAAAAALLAARLDDGAGTPDTYRPHTTAGVYVPTAIPAVPQWPARKPWLMSSAAQFRPAAPPALTSEAWARDFDEVKALGSRASAQRNAEQTEVARFWDYSLPPIYHGIVRTAALAPGRSLAANARLFATAAQAMDDALIAVFEAKYHYHFWRPVTAIRNADQDGNDATARDASWTPLIDVPMHPEYPSAHSALAAALGAVVEAEFAGKALPVLATSSPTAKNATRRYARIDALVREVGDARVWAGIHYRVSVDVGARMGRQVGELAVARRAREAQ